MNPEVVRLAETMRRDDLHDLIRCADYPQIIHRMNKSYLRLASHRLVHIVNENYETSREKYECKTAFITGLGQQVAEYFTHELKGE